MKNPLLVAFKIALLLVAFLLSCSTKLFAQAPVPPLPVEVLFGHNQIYFQMVVKKKFTPTSNFGFFTVATFSADYHKERRNNSLTMPVQFSYTFGKGFGIMAGGEKNSVVGFSPIVGPQHSYASRTFLAVTVASFFLNDGKDFKIFGLYEYKPAFNQKWSFYSRLQFIYNHNINEGSHNRSYLFLRAGLRRDLFTFGMGANLDQFGPAKHYQENFGPFVRWEFK